MRDVVIVGAGPAGSHLARRLAEAGLDVLLIEEDARAGMNVICSGILGREAFERFEIPAESVLGHLRSIRFHSPSGKTVEYHPDAPLAGIVSRERFDDGLARRAVRAGAEFWGSAAARTVSVQGDGVRVGVSREGSPVEVRARLCVLATGYGSPLIARCGFGKPAGVIQSAQATVSLRDPGAAEIFLGSRLAPGGFGWAVPIGRGEARVGVVTARKSAFHLRQILERSELGPRPAAAGERIQSCRIPVGTLPGTVSDRLMVVGEAAGQVKTTTQGGIYYGLLCAESAAEAAVGAFRRGDLSAAALAPYDRRWRETLETELHWGLMLRQFYSDLSDRQIDRLFDLARIDGVLPMVSRRVQFDWHSPVIRAALNRGFLGGMIRSVLGMPAESRL